MYRIEFIGRPGAGKTTIRKNLISHLRRRDENRYLTIEEAFFYVSSSKIDRMYRIILHALPYKIAIRCCRKMMNRSLMQFEAQNRFLSSWGKSLASFMMSPGFESISLVEKNITISGFLEIGALYECMVEEFDEDKVIFFDEGFVQKSYMFLTVSGNQYVDENYLVRYLENIPLPDLIIYVKAGANLCYNRMLDRPQGLTGRLKKCEKNVTLNFLERAETHLQNLSLWLKNNSNVRVIEIYNDGELGASFEYLSSEIKLRSSLGYFKDGESE